jgi:antitoxin VapB
MVEWSCLRLGGSVSLTIKNARVRELALEAARRTGRSQTGVIELALQKLLDAMEHGDATAMKRARMDTVLSEIRAVLSDEDRQALATATDGLYDQDGLPR